MKHKAYLEPFSSAAVSGWPSYLVSPASLRTRPPRLCSGYDEGLECHTRFCASRGLCKSCSLPGTFW